MKYRGPPPGYCAPLRDMTVAADDDDTCPDCKGRGVDKYDFDCRRCLGEGAIDE